ncbi:hypothetical protein EV44_g1743 [Erysiphe necator]|uniref:Uncharacterized protein n=1 Tax=Uncinula necator TaxID=52586 RepID=A0A0B1PEN7_UNCNE|nr:hypothetical protein EV44_g1743 [Erysiphe necator]
MESQNITNLFLPHSHYCIPSNLKTPSSGFQLQQQVVPDPSQRQTPHGAYPRGGTATSSPLASLDGWHTPSDARRPEQD